MKKILALFLTLALVLSGCGVGEGKPSENTAVTETEIPAQTAAQPKDPEPVEILKLREQDYGDLVPMGQKVLLVKEARRNVVAVQTDTMLPSGALKLEVPLLMEASDSVSSMGISVFSENKHQVIFYNTELREYARADLPLGISGLPVVSPDHREVFYISGENGQGNLMVLQANSGIIRTIRSDIPENMKIQFQLFSGEILGLSQDVEGENLKESEKKTVFISTADGRSLADCRGVSEVSTAGQLYFLTRMDGVYRQRILGLRGEAPMEFTPDGILTQGLSLSSMVEHKQTEKGLELTLYHLQKGTAEASVLLPGVELTKLCAAGEYVWVLGRNQETGELALYRWNPKLSGVKEPVSCVKPLATRENPDEEGLAYLNDRAKELSEATGVKISIYRQALKYWDSSTPEAEYQVPVIKKMLDELQQAVQLFPKGFLSHFGSVRILLVRSLDNGAPYAYEVSGRSSTICITSTENGGRCFLEAMGLIIDSFVLGHSRKYDEWNELNPDGFRYLMDGEDQPDSSLYKGENPWFADEMAMKFPSYDRSRVFYYAICEGNDKLFSGLQMQRKLETVCRAIREAYGLEGKKETYPWEQYLNISLCPEA